MRKVMNCAGISIALVGDTCTTDEDFCAIDEDTCAFDEDT